MPIIRKPRWPMWFTPKRELLVVLTVLAAVGVWKIGWRETLPQLVLGATVAALVDYALFRLIEKKNYLPDAGFLSGMIVALVLVPGVDLWIVAVLSALAVLSKHAIKYKHRHIFNPANFGLLLGIFLFPQVLHGWWGETIPWLTAVLGLFLVGRIEAWRMIAAYIGMWTVILSAIVLAGPGPLSLVVALPWLLLSTLSFFFLFVMFIEPMTRPITQKGRLLFGVAVALFSYLFSLAGFQAPLIFALAAGNLLTPFVFNRLKP